MTSGGKPVQLLKQEMTSGSKPVQRLELGTSSENFRKWNTPSALEVDHVKVNVVKSLNIQSETVAKADVNEMAENDTTSPSLRSTTEESGNNDATNYDHNQTPMSKSFNQEEMNLSQGSNELDLESNTIETIRGSGNYSNNDNLLPELYYPPRRNTVQRYFSATPYPPPEIMSRKRQKVSDAGTERGNIENKKPKTSSNFSTPSMLLNEICSGLIFQYSDRIGPPHESTFEVTVVYPPNEKEYKGSGRSKKLAKQNVAEIILTDIGHPLPPMPTEEGNTPGSEIVEDKEMISSSVKSKPRHETRSPFTYPFATANDSMMADFIPQPEPTIDFTSDDFLLFVPANSNSDAPQAPCRDPSYVSPELFKRLEKTCIVTYATNALNCLLGSDGEIRYEFLPDDVERPPHDKIFEVKLMFKIPSRIKTNQGNQADTNDRVFIASGGSKKKAKSEAARLGLISILGIPYYNALAEYQSKSLINVTPPNSSRKQKTASFSDNPMSPTEAGMMNEEVDPEAHEYSIVFAQEMAKRVTERHAIVVKGDEKAAPLKVLAGVVMTLGTPMLENMHIVSVATGTKCIEGDYMSEKGLALNDCHAEILANRCLREFLYSQIETLRNMGNSANKPPSTNEIILEKVESTGGDVDVMRFKLREGVKFHLYISTSPCGDARIFSPKGLDTSDDTSMSPTPCVPGEETADTHPNRISRGQLRAKIEAGEGTLPVTNLRAAHGSQTWDGIMLGNAVHTMSCSDKICRWNVVGAQGALLSVFMDPIYYSSIVLGSLHHPIHFKRAVFSRIENLETLLEPPFRVNKPRLLMVADKGKRRVKKSPNHSVTWTCSWNSYELISSAKGRCEPEGVASRLAKRLAFMRFLQIYKNKTGQRENFLNISYENAKKLAIPFQESKAKFVNSMNDSGYGIWISKPLEQDSFLL